MKNLQMVKKYHNSAGVMLVVSTGGMYLGFGHLITLTVGKLSCLTWLELERQFYL